MIIAVVCLIRTDGLETIDAFKIPHKDKYVHFALYFILAMLWCLALGQAKKTSLRSRWLVFLYAAGYGILIEVLQGVLTTQRSPEVADALVNALGAAMAIILLPLLQKREKTN